MSSTANLCEPCSSLNESAILSLEEIKEQLHAMPLWSLLEDEDDGMVKLSRTYVAKNFQAALDSINAIGAIAEREGHHPDFHLTDYRQVQLILYTHKLKGITANDLNLARMVDAEVKVVYSPKWLREHPQAGGSEG